MVPEALRLELGTQNPAPTKDGFGVCGGFGGSFVSGLVGFGLGFVGFF